MCLLDLEYGLPVQVRDQALGMTNEGLPESDPGKEYALQRMQVRRRDFAGCGRGCGGLQGRPLGGRGRAACSQQRLHLPRAPLSSPHLAAAACRFAAGFSFARSQPLTSHYRPAHTPCPPTHPPPSPQVEGDLDRSQYETHKPNDLLMKLRRTEPYYQRNRARICSFFVRGECKRGAECPYRHEMPTSGAPRPLPACARRHAPARDVAAREACRCTAAALRAGLAFPCMCMPPPLLALPVGWPPAADTPLSPLATPCAGPLSEQNIKDRYYGVNDPVANKMMDRANKLAKLTPPEDQTICTLFVGGVTGACRGRRKPQQRPRSALPCPAAAAWHGAPACPPCAPRLPAACRAACSHTTMHTRTLSPHPPPTLRTVFPCRRRHQRGRPARPVLPLWRATQRQEGGLPQVRLCDLCHARRCGARGGGAGQQVSVGVHGAGVPGAGRGWVGCVGTALHLGVLSSAC